MRWLLLGCAVLLSACIQPELVSCGDQLCPRGDMCITGICASADQLAKCSGQLDGTACTLTSGSVGRCENQICVVGGCGNHRMDFGEVCDDGNVTSGDGCSGTCDSDETCGNGILDVVTGESCDCGSDAAHMPASCTAPNSDDPSSACTTGCKLRRCGDGEVAGPEQCDGAITVDVSCAKFGYYSGQVSCSSLCQFDPSTCNERCGDQILQSQYELCDTAPPPGETCLDFGFDLGWLGCTSVCTPGLADCDRLGWARVHPRVFTASNVIARGDRVLIQFTDGAVALLLKDIEDDPTDLAVAIATTATHSYVVTATGVVEQVATGPWQPITVAAPWTSTPVAAFASDSPAGLFVAVPGDPDIHRWDGTSWLSYAIPGGALANPRFGGSRRTPLLYDAAAASAFTWNVNGFYKVQTPAGTTVVRDLADTAVELYIATEGGVFHQGFGAVSWTMLANTTGVRLASNTLGGIDDLTVANTIVRIGSGSLAFDAPAGTSAISESGGAMYVAGPSGGVFAVLKGAWQLLPQPQATPTSYVHIHSGDLGKGEIMVTGSKSAFLIPGQTWQPLVVSVGTVDVSRSSSVTASIMPYEFDYAFGNSIAIYPLANVDPQMIYRASNGSNYYAAGKFGVATYNELTGSIQEDVMTYKLAAIDGTSNTDVYAVGRDDIGNGVIVHYNGTGWSTFTTNIVMGPLNDIYIAPNGTIFAISDQAIYRGTPTTTWTTIDVPGAALRGISGTSDTDIFVAGGTTFGFSFSGLAHYDGAHFYPLRLPATGSPRDLFVTRGAVYLLLTDTSSNTDTVWSLVRSTPW